MVGEGRMPRLRLTEYHCLYHSAFSKLQSSQNYSCGIYAGKLVNPCAYPSLRLITLATKTSKQLSFGH